MHKNVFEVVVPTEEEVEVKDGERQTVEKKMYAGYILVSMILDDPSSTPGSIEDIAKSLLVTEETATQEEVQEETSEEPSIPENN